MTCIHGHAAVKVCCEEVLVLWVPHFFCFIACFIHINTWSDHLHCTPKKVQAMQIIRLASHRVCTKWLNYISM